MLKAVNDWRDEARIMGAPKRSMMPPFVDLRVSRSFGETCVCESLEPEIPAPVDDIEFLLSLEVPQDCFAFFEVSR